MSYANLQRASTATETRVSKNEYNPLEMSILGSVGCDLVFLTGVTYDYPPPEERVPARPLTT